MALDTRAVPDAVIRKITRRVLPLPFALGLVSIVDRTNVSYAALEMNKDLGFSSAVYGLGAGVLFFGYFLFEVPGNLMLERFGARRWLARIAVTWGVIAAAMALVRDETVFYLLRFLLGAAEAGLFPGVVLYLTYWFPLRYRARATGLFMLCIPCASIIGAPLSGWLVGQDGVLGMSGWQFLFLIQGAPAIVLGLLLWGLLTDRPEDAPWLDPADRDRLTAELHAEAGRTDSAQRLSAGLRSGRVWAFTAVYFCFAIAQYGLIFFLPQILKKMDFSNTQVGFVGAVPYLAGAIAMVLISRDSDRTGERRWHYAASMLVMAAGLAGTALTLANPALALVCLAVVGIGAYGSLGTFWPLPTTLLAGTAAAAGIAVINSVGNIGGFVGPYAVGYLSDHTGGFAPGLIVLAVFAAVGAVVFLLASRPR